MKKLITTLVFLFAIAFMNAQVYRGEILLTGDFTSATVPNLLSGWVADPPVTGGVLTSGWRTMMGEWGIMVPDFQTVPFAAKDGRGTTGNADHWLFSPSFELQAGVTYSISFAFAGSTVQNFTVRIGTAQNAAGMTETISTRTTTAGGAMPMYTRVTEVFTPAVSGTYYLGFHCTSAPGGILAINHVEVLDPVPAPVPAPFFENFATVTVPELPTNWRLNTPNTGKSWVTTTFDGVNAAYIESTGVGSTDPHNAWLFTPGITLEGNTSYDLEFRLWGDQKGTTMEKLAIKAGLGPFATSMSIDIYNNSDVDTDDDWETILVSFTPPANGVFYLGFHAHSEEGAPAANGMYITDVRIAKTPPPPPVFVTVPYLQDFEDTEGMNLPHGWTRSPNPSNANYNNGWGSTDNLMGPQGMQQFFIHPNAMSKNSGWRYAGIVTNAADAWLISPGLGLTAGTTYEISFYVATRLTTDRLNVRIGTSNDAADMATATQLGATIADAIAKSTAVPAWWNLDKVVLQFTPTATDDYFLGFQALAGGQGFIGIDNVSITEIKTNDLALTTRFAPQGATQIPVGQTVLPATRVRNFGSAQQTGITVSGDLNGTPITTTGPAVLDFGQMATFTPAGGQAIVLGPNTLTYTVSQDQTDEDLANNTITLNFEGTRNVFAVDNATLASESTGDAKFVNSLGNIFEITTATNLSQIVLGFAPNPKGEDQDFQISLFRMDSVQVNGLALTGLNPFPSWPNNLTRPAAGGFMAITVPTNVPQLTPGRYFLCVNEVGQAVATNKDRHIGLLHDGNLDASWYERPVGTGQIIRQHHQGALAIRMIMRVDACDEEPENLAVTSNPFEATFTWDGNAPSYRLILDDGENTTTHIAVGNSTTVAVNPSTAYTWTLQAMCDATQGGDIIEGPGFTTGLGFIVNKQNSYFEGFEGTTDQNLPAEWTRTPDPNNFLQLGWGTTADAGAGLGLPAGSYAGARSAGVLLFHNADPTDAWLFSPALKLTAGETYVVSFAAALGVGAGGSPFNDQLTVKMGRGNTIADMATADVIFASEATFPNMSWQLITVLYTPTTTGIHYLGFHTFAPNLSFFGYTAIDNVSMVAPHENDLAITIASAPQGFTQIPVDQLIPAARVENIGLAKQTNVSVEGNFNGTPFATTPFGEDLDVFERETFTPSGTPPAIALGANTLTYTVSQDQTDGNPANNTATMSFTGTKNIYAVDNSTIATGGSSAELGNALNVTTAGNIFEITTETTLSQVMIGFAPLGATRPVGNDGLQYRVSLYRMQNETQTQSTQMAGFSAAQSTSQDVTMMLQARPTEAGFVVLDAPETVLTPGRYFLCFIEQGMNRQIGVLHDKNTDRSWYMRDHTGALTPQLGFGALAIRMVMKVDECTDAPTNLAVVHDVDEATFTWDGEATSFKLTLTDEDDNDIVYTVVNKNSLTIAVNPGTTYNWTLQGMCDATQGGAIVAGEEFTTAECTAFIVTKATPFKEGFEGTTGHELPNGWTRNVDPENNELLAAWGTTDQVVRPLNALTILPAWEGGRYAAVLSGGEGVTTPSEDVNAWLFSHTMRLTAGETYTVSFRVALDTEFVAFAAHAPEFAEWYSRLTVKMGRGNTVAAMENAEVIFTSQGTEANATWILVNAQFTPTTSGRYTLGFHNHTPLGESPFMPGVPMAIGRFVGIDDVFVGIPLANDLAVTLSNAPQGATQIPVTQTLPAARVTNLGTAQQTGIEVSAMFNDAPITTTEPVTELNASASAIFVPTGTPTIVLGENTLTYTVSQDQTDENEDNNTVNFSFTGTKNILAVDGATTTSEGVPGMMGNRGNIFEITTTTTLSQVMIGFAPGTEGEGYNVSLYRMDGTKPQLQTEPSAMWSAPINPRPLRPAEGFTLVDVRNPQGHPDAVSLTPGRYFLSVSEAAGGVPSIGLLHDGNTERSMWERRSLGQLFQQPDLGAAAIRMVMVAETCEDVPTNLAVNHDLVEATLSWEGNALSYRVIITDGEDFDTTFRTMGHSVTIPVELEATYTWTVQAMCGAVQGGAVVGGDEFTIFGSRTVTYAQAANGTLSVTRYYDGENIVVASGEEVAHGTVLTITATPNAHYHVATLEVNDVDFTSGETHTVTANTTIEVAFAINQYTVTVSMNYDAGNVEIVGQTDLTATFDANTSVTVKATPDSEHYFVRWAEIPGSSPVTTDAEYMFNIVGDIELRAYFAEIGKFLLTLERDPVEGGTVTGDGEYKEGDDVPITATANENFEFVKWEKEGVLVSNVANFSYTMPEENVVLTAVFASTLRTITASVDGGNGTIDPSGEITITRGESQTFTFTPDTDYKIYRVYVDDVYNAAAVENGTYTFTNVQANHTIVVSFIEESVIPTYVVSIQTPTGGTITVKNGDETVTHLDELDHGTELTLTATPQTNWEFVEWGHDGHTTANHTHILIDHVTISATFRDISTSIAVTSKGEMFAIYPNPTTDVLHIQTEEIIKQIYVLDIAGKVMMQFNGNQKTIDLQTLKAGHYIVRIHTATAIVPIRVVKQ